MCKPLLAAHHAVARILVSLLTLVAAIGAAPTLAATHVEFPDAGQTQATAQPTASTGLPGVVLTDIFGTLRSQTDADLYLINIFNAAAFSATTVNPIGGFLDTQLFLLSETGAPIYLNDDDPGGLTTLSTLPAGSAFGPTAPGLYLLGIALSGFDPVNVVNQLLFATGLSTDVRRAATGLQPGRLGGFSDNTFFADFGPYDIRLTGAATVAEPASLALLALGGSLLGFTRPRRTTANTLSE